jgi:hypothetical protein
VFVEGGRGKVGRGGREQRERKSQKRRNLQCAICRTVVRASSEQVRGRDRRGDLCKTHRHQTPRAL